MYYISNLKTNYELKCA